MYDRQTQTYWSQLLGEAVEGELVGTKLEFLPSWMTTWEEWKKMHPDTLALDKGGRRGKRDTYDGYYRSSSAGVIGETIRDDRLYTKEFVIGVELADQAVAYPFSVLNDQPVVNHSVDGNELLVVFDPGTATGLVYDRRVDGEPLTFRSAGDAFVLADEETDSTWDAFSGEAIAGPLTGQTLTRIKSTTVFWFGWKDFHTDSLIYGLEG